MEVDREAWIKETLSHEEFFLTMWDKIPRDLFLQREMLISRLWRSPDHWKVAQGIQQ